MTPKPVDGVHAGESTRQGTAGRGGVLFRILHHRRRRRQARSLSQTPKPLTPCPTPQALETRNPTLERGVALQAQLYFSAAERQPESYLGQNLDLQRENLY